MRAEALGFLREQLDHAGALDVSITAVQMKKNRPGHRLTILYPSEQAAAIHEAIFRHSTTFGFRDRAVLRRVLDREIVTVNTVDGPCRVKLGAWNGRLVRVRPEYEDVAALARATGRSIDAVESLVLDECRRRGMSV